MSLVRPDYWIPHLSVYAFGVIQHQAQDVPDATIHTVHPLDYVFAIFITVGMLLVQGFVLARLIRRGGRWYFRKMKQIDLDATRIQANRTLLTLLTSSVLGALTFVSCVLLCVNFTIRIWALGLIVKPDEVRYGGAATDNRVNCSFGTPNCLTMKPQFAIAVENLEQATGFMMQIVVLMASGLLAYRSVIISGKKLWMPVLVGLPFLIAIVSTVAGVIAIYRNPYKYARQPGWLYYRYQANDPFMNTQISIARITPIITTAALVGLNLVFTVSVLSTQARGYIRGRLPLLLVDSALPSAILGVVLLFVPVYGAHSDKPFFYMRLARYSLRTLWAGLLIVTPQLVVLRAIRADCRDVQPLDEKTVIEPEEAYGKEV